MVASDDFAEFLREQLAPLAPIAFRRVFGKTGLFRSGLMFGLVADNMLYLRVDDGNREAFRDAAAFPPLHYVRQGRFLDLPFWRAPEYLFDDPDALVLWARLALGAAGRVAAQRRPRR